MSAIAAVVLPIWAWHFLHYGFFPVYSKLAYTRSSFDSQLAEGVYRFRILGAWLVRVVDDHLGDVLVEVLHNRPLWMTAAVPGMDVGLYGSLVLVNLVAYLAMSILLQRLLWDPDRPLTPALYLLVQVIVLASSWVMTPYDMLAYAFLLAAVACLRWRSGAAPYALVLITVLGTLTRETQALAIACAAVFALRSSRSEARRGLVLTGVSALAFAATYVGLRVVLGWDTSVINGLTVFDVGLLAILGLAGALVAVYMVHCAAVAAAGGSGRTSATVLYLLATPYLVAILLAGAWNEVRLIVPLVLVQAVATVTADPTSESVLRDRVRPRQVLARVTELARGVAPPTRARHEKNRKAAPENVPFVPGS
ncbi:hypothetical protein MOQ72_31195 [Saccharopolyspora sp. K220]|uniref:hypothetical protein n=1 Tax=Saccharopolyspora soli TaxID=2926618 RepID=UPI001F5833D5|nr:hypothetical protein [Saccharopolyspora soli]MCI2421911.1 hypothetical protein [Saccharopolyspora soli]